MSLRNQFRSIIEWQDPDPDVLFYKWTESGDEIKDASKLIVNPGQGCLFVYEGKVEGVYTTQGKVNLETENIPFWTTIKNIMNAMESEHKVGIYFFRTAECSNIRWGTPTPIKYKDPVYQFPVGLGAFGNFSVYIEEPEYFFTNIVAGAEIYSARDIQLLVLSRITPGITDFLAEAKFSFIDIDANREEISKAVVEKVYSIFFDLGFKLSDFRIEGTNFDEETQRRIGRISDMSAEAQAAQAAGVDYVQMQKLEAMREAARNPGGAAGLASGIAVGAELGKMVSDQSNAGQSSPGGADAGPSGTDDVAAKLRQLKSLFEQDLITQQEYDSKRQSLLDQM
jgi:membrane protease subunit (stomatin/prohibitin family)